MPAIAIISKRPKALLGVTLITATAVKYFQISLPVMLFY